jgi:hypothetical protein
MTTQRKGRSGFILWYVGLHVSGTARLMIKHRFCLLAPLGRGILIAWFHKRVADNEDGG